MNPTQRETGEQLFDRIFNVVEKTTVAATETNKQPLKADSRIFTNDFEAGDLYEISGKEGSSKSELVIHLISSFLLPGKWIVKLKDEETQISLARWSFYPQLTNTELKSKVILIDNDLKFSILRLFSVMELRIKHSLKSKYEETKDRVISQINRSMLEAFIKSCLENLVIYKCSSSEQFLLTLASCEYYVKQEQQQQRHNHIPIPIFIDSINSNFEFIDPLLLNTDDHTEKYTISLVNRILSKYKKLICIIATRVEFEQLNSKYEFNTYSKWQKIISKRVSLKKLNSNEFQLTNHQNEQFVFTINNIGLLFKESA